LSGRKKEASKEYYTREIAALLSPGILEGLGYEHQESN